MVKNIVTGAGGLGFDSRASQIQHSRQRLATDTFLRSCNCLGAEQRRWHPLLVTRFGVKQRLQ